MSADVDVVFYCIINNFIFQNEICDMLPVRQHLAIIKSWTNELVCLCSLKTSRIGKGLSEIFSQPFLQYETWPMSLFIVIVTLCEMYVAIVYLRYGIV